MVTVPPRPFETQTPEVVRTRMFANLNTDLDVREGSLAFTLMAPSADEASIIWQVLDSMVDYAFAQTAYGGFLDARAEEHGVFRRRPVRATGTVEFSFVGGSVTIPAGTAVSNTVLPGSDTPVVVFETDVATTATSSPASVAVTSVDINLGSAANLDAGQLDRLATVVAGVTSVTNPAAMTGGADLESDESLRRRYMQTVAASRGAGTVDDYELWALAVPGVGRVTVEPTWNGAGTVRLLILDTNGAPANTALLEAVRNYVADRNPFPAVVTVAAPAGVTVNIEADITTATGLAIDDVRAAVRSSVEDLFETIDVDEDVILTQVGSAILVEGVEDYSGLTLNGSAANIDIVAGQYAVLGTITLT